MVCWVGGEQRAMTADFVVCAAIILLCLLFAVSVAKQTKTFLCFESVECVIMGASRWVVMAMVTVELRRARALETAAVAANMQR